MIQTEITINLPKLGESITGAVVVRWFKKEGDFVKEDEALLEVTTDKVNSEIPSTTTGVLKKIIAIEDAELLVGEPLCIIDSSETIEKEDSLFLSPKVKSLIKEKEICKKSLNEIKGTGEACRITKKDVCLYLNEKKETYHEQKVILSTLRKTIADNLSKSFYSAPHATLVMEINFTEILKFLDKIKETFFEKNGFKITITSFLISAISLALKEFSYLNATYHKDFLLLKNEVNLGLAVNVDDGVIVPVIKNSDKISILEISSQVASLAYKAKTSSLKVEETQMGTATLSNFGMSGALMGTPIIRYPEVAIFGIGSISKKTAVINDCIAICSLGYLSLTFDHRVVDGMYASGCLKKIKQLIENGPSHFHVNI